MIAVYRVVPDVNNYRYLLSEDAEGWLKFRFDGTPVGESWDCPSAYPENLTRPVGHFWGTPRPGTFAIAGETASALARFLDQSCETLPLEYEGGGKLLL